MIELKAPEKPFLIFLAGSIEMGSAEKWQDQTVKLFKKFLPDSNNVIILNPRRDDWDSSWTQDPSEGTKFSEQVDWELDGLDKADYVVFWFDSNTKSPITLAELGYIIGKGTTPFSIKCEPEFWRYGNVIKLCERAKQPVDYVNGDTPYSFVQTIANQLTALGKGGTPYKT